MTSVLVLCPGQGAQVVGMGSAWAESSTAAKAIFQRADDVLGDSLGESLSSLCFQGPAETLNKTNVSQPAIYTCSVACWAGLTEAQGDLEIVGAAGLSLGEYTALHLAGAFSFEDGLQMVARRGMLMQQAAEASQGGMVALVGADEDQAAEVCSKAAGNDVLVCANFNAPGQIVLSGHAAACDRAAAIASDMGLRATTLTVAGAFHSPLMASAAEEMAVALASVGFGGLQVPVWSNVTGQAHEAENTELLRQRLVEQITHSVRWSQSCQTMAGPDGLLKGRISGSDDSTAEGDATAIQVHELAPGATLRGLMRRIDRSIKVTSHDKPI